MQSYLEFINKCDLTLDSLSHFNDLWLNGIVFNVYKKHEECIVETDNHCGVASKFMFKPMCSIRKSAYVIISHMCRNSYIQTQPLFGRGIYIVKMQFFH